MNYYNEWEAYPAQWIRNLQAAGYLPDGVVDERSITDVKAKDLEGATQAHFFAGIGGWPFALRLAGWNSDAPVWTGSCPCQPFSVAGQGRGEKDDRHLWPEFFRLIRECHPPTVFGEQVASSLGRKWLARVQADMEALGYAFGSADLCAAGVKAPHIRQRLFWVASSKSFGHGAPRMETEPRRGQCPVGPNGGDVVFGLDYASSSRYPPERKESKSETRNQAWLRRSQSRRGDSWGTFDIITGVDGKARRIESGLKPLAHGVPARVGKLRAYGNAIVPEIAVEFVKAYLEAVA